MGTRRAKADHKGRRRQKASSGSPQAPAYKHGADGVSRMKGHEDGGKCSLERTTLFQHEAGAVRPNP